MRAVASIASLALAAVPCYRQAPAASSATRPYVPTTHQLAIVSGLVLPASTDEPALLLLRLSLDGPELVTLAPALADTIRGVFPSTVRRKEPNESDSDSDSDQSESEDSKKQASASTPAPVPARITTALIDHETVLSLFPAVVFAGSDQFVLVTLTSAPTSEPTKFSLGLVFAHPRLQTLISLSCPETVSHVIVEGLSFYTFMTPRDEGGKTGQVCAFQLLMSLR